MKKSHSTNHFSFPIFSLFFTFLGSALFGCLLGIGYLITFPPKAVSTNEPLQKLREGEDLLSGFSHLQTTTKYYRVTSIKQSAKVLAKKLYASQTGEIEISAIELNGWAVTTFATDENGDGRNSKDSSITFVPQIPVFQIASNQLHIAYPFRAQAFGKRGKFTVLASGDFQNSESSSPTWNMRRFYINSAPIPFKQSVYEFLKPRVEKMMSDSDDIEKLKATWGKIRSIDVGDVTLSIVRSN